MNKKEVMSILDKSVNASSLTINMVANTTDSGTTCGGYDSTNVLGEQSCWDYWQNYYHPYIYPSYPVYIQDRAKDKGKESFEIIKGLMDKKFIKLNTVKEFIDLMNFFIKIL